MRKWSIALILVGLLVLGMGGGILAQTPAIAQIVGTITGIGGNEVIITPPAPASPLTLNVIASTEIKVPGKEPASLADLKVWDPVKARYETATLNALEIAVEAAKVQGEITALDATAKTVTIKPGVGDAVTLKDLGRTEYEVWGKEPAGFADLKVGDPVTAQYIPATKEALEIEVQAVKEATVQGEITALDSATQKVTIKPRVRDAVTITVTTGTELEVWGKEPAVFADLKVGDWVSAEYNPATKEALEMEVKGKARDIEAREREDRIPAPRHGYFGTVKAKDATPPTLSLTLDTKQGEVTLALDADTQYWNPPNKDASLDDVKVGDRVAVLAEGQDSAFLAKRVLVIPAKPMEPTRLQITATVTSVVGNTITLTKDSQIFTVELPAGLAGKVEVGDVLVVTLLRTPGVERYLASGMMKGDELQERLQSHADKVKGKKAETDEERGKQSQDLERLRAMLQDNMEKHQELMDKVIEKAPPQARDALQKAMENSRRGWEQAIAALEKDKTPTPRGR